MHFVLIFRSATRQQTVSSITTVIGSLTKAREALHQAEAPKSKHEKTPVKVLEPVCLSPPPSHHERTPSATTESVVRRGAVDNPIDLDKTSPTCAVLSPSKMMTSSPFTTGGDSDESGDESVVRRDDAEMTEPMESAPVFREPVGLQFHRPLSKPKIPDASGPDLNPAVERKPFERMPLELQVPGKKPVASSGHPLLKPSDLPKSNFALTPRKPADLPKPANLPKSGFELTPQKLPLQLQHIEPPSVRNPFQIPPRSGANPFAMTPRRPVKDEPEGVQVMPPPSQIMEPRLQTPQSSHRMLPFQSELRPRPKFPHLESQPLYTPQPFHFQPHQAAQVTHFLLTPRRMVQPQPASFIVTPRRPVELAEGDSPSPDNVVDAGEAETQPELEVFGDEPDWTKPDPDNVNLLSREVAGKTEVSFRNGVVILKPATLTAARKAALKVYDPKSNDADDVQDAFQRYFNVCVKDLFASLKSKSVIYHGTDLYLKYHLLTYLTTDNFRCRDLWKCFICQCGRSATEFAATGFGNSS